MTKRAFVECTGDALTVNAGTRANYFVKATCSEKEISAGMNPHTERTLSKLNKTNLFSAQNFWVFSALYFNFCGKITFPNVLLYYAVVLHMSIFWFLVRLNYQSQVWCFLSFILSFLRNCVQHGNDWNHALRWWNETCFMLHNGIVDYGWL